MEEAVGQHVRNVLTLPCGGDCGSAHFSRAAHSTLSERLEKTHSLTLLLQNCLGHLNILLQDLWHWHINGLLPDLQLDDAWND